MENFNVSDFRKELEDIVSQWTLKEKSKIEKIIDKKINDDVSIRIYRNNNTSVKLPVFLFLHGGGWIRGSVETHDDLCRNLAVDGSFIVVSVDYRLAPESLFPNAVDDAYKSLNWTLNHSEEINAERNNIAVGGDSSGGNLAIALSQRAKENGILLKGLVVAYPPVNYDFNTESYQEYGEGFVLTKELMKKLWDEYLGDQKNANSHLASVIHNDFTGFPPTLIIGSDKDPLRDDSKLLFENLVAFSVPVTYSFYPETRHAFLLRTAIEKEALIAQGEIINFLKTKVYRVQKTIY